MRICRWCLDKDPQPRWGVVEENCVWPWDEGGGRAVEAIPLGELLLLPPAGPCRVFGIGRNYADHIQELNPGWTAPDPLVFMKPDTALVGQGAPILLPPDIGRVDYEGELALVLGRGGRNIRREDALDHVLGLTCANDISARDLQQSDGQWIRAKGHDSFCPLGPWLVKGLDPRDLAIRTFHNGKLVQDSRTSKMLHAPDALIAYLSSFCTLQAGDVILTGTPAGVGPIQPGDWLRVEIEGIGSLENPVLAGEATHAT